MNKINNNKLLWKPPQYASSPCKLIISSYLFARWHLFRHVNYLRHQQQVNLWPFDLESGVRVTCDVGYVCANFSLPKPLCSRVRPDVRDRQTSDVRQKHRLMPSPYGGGGIIIVIRPLSERVISKLCCWFNIGRNVMRCPAQIPRVLCRPPVPFFVLVESVNP